MRLSMHIQGQFNHRDIVVPIDLVGKLEKVGKAKFNTWLNRWELTVPSQEIYDRYAIQFKPRREV